MQLLTKYLLISIVFLLSTHSGKAQEDRDSTQHGILGDFKLPNPLGNRAFNSVMNGIVDADFAYQYAFRKPNIVVQAGMKYGYWDVESTFFAGTVIDGSMKMYNPFIGVGYRKWFASNVFADFLMKGGYSFNVSSSPNCSENYLTEGMTLEPKAGIYLKSNELLSFGFNLNYHYQATQFSEANICIDDFPGLPAEASQGNTSYFSVGFGFYTYLPKSKR